MAVLIPALSSCAGRMTSGERRLAERLQQKLEDDYLLWWDVPIGPDKVGTFDTELGHEFFCGLARDAGMTVHLREIAGENAHHILEATFKSFARALRAAVETDPRVEGIPSTKGAL